MTKKQTENTAKYLYDISKIIFTLAVAGNLISKEKFDPLVLTVGVICAFLSFLLAYLLDKGE